MAISKWNKRPLQELCFRIGDGLHGTPEYNNSSELYFINGNNLNSGKIEITESTKTVTSEDYKKNFIELNENSLLLSINGTIGSMAFYRNENIMLGKSAAYLNFKTGINRFFFYYFQLKNVQQYFYNVATGSTIKNLSLKSIQDFEVPAPSITEWEPIAKVLSDLDAKIELNNKINAELESMAKLIYDYWFVQFDFPMSEAQAKALGKPELKGKPYKSSGGKMVYNEDLKREIPEGWEVDYIGSFATVKKGKLITQKTANQRGKVKVVSAGVDFSYFHDEANYAENTISISASGASAGFINFWREPIFACDCTTVRGSNDAESLYLLHFLKMRQEYIYQQARGSAQPHVYPKDIEGLRIEIPPCELLHDFGAKVLSGNSLIANNQKENQKLEELRDWLLPMLMNGQVTVN